MSPMPWCSAIRLGAGPICLLSPVLGALEATGIALGFLGSTRTGCSKPALDCITTPPRCCMAALWIAESAAAHDAPWSILCPSTCLQFSTRNFALENIIQNLAVFRNSTLAVFRNDRAA